MTDPSQLYEEEVFDPGKKAGAGAADVGDPEASEWPWPVMPMAAYHGLAGEVVATIAPHTESDNVALHMQYLTSFGSAIGRQPFYQVEATRHYANLFCIMAGRTSRSRKGTAGDRVREISEIAEPDWARECIHSGMSSGEGMIMPIRDPVYGMKKGVEEMIDPGVADKRLLLDEREFSQVLGVMKREGNILSRMVRDAWDCRPVIGTLTKHSRTKATNPYISITGHITIHELRGLLDQTAMFNGFANRFLFACVRRSKLLPNGGSLARELVARLGLKSLEAIEAARAIQQVTMTPDAARIWADVYPELTRDLPGLLGAICARAEAQTTRLALIYALIDHAPQIGREHLEAALATWSYCEASARYIFGELLGDPVADTILRALRATGINGLSRSDLFTLFGRHLPVNKIDVALVQLLTAGKIRRDMQKAAGSGRPPEMWFAI